MSASPLLLVILILCAMCAVLAGMAVFSSSRPPDTRVNMVIQEMEELKGLVSQLQKSVIAMDRKLEKESRDARTETREVLEKLGSELDKRMRDLVG
jgi:hypothetical protein